MRKLEILYTKESYQVTLGMRRDMSPVQQKGWLTWADTPLQSFPGHRNPETLNHLVSFDPGNIPVVLTGVS